MSVETLKDALSAGWRVHAKCLGGKVDNGKSMAKCVNSRERPFAYAMAAFRDWSGVRRQLNSTFG